MNKCLSESDWPPVRRSYRRWHTPNQECKRTTRAPPPPTPDQRAILAAAAAHRCGTPPPPKSRAFRHAARAAAAVLATPRRQRRRRLPSAARREAHVSVRGAKSGGQAGVGGLDQARVFWPSTFTRTPLPRQRKGVPRHKAQHHPDDPPSPPHLVKHHQRLLGFA